MFVYAIVVGFCAGVLNCLIMACTVDIFGQKRTVEVWNYVNLMLGIGFVGGPPIGAWFTSTVVSECAFLDTRTVFSQFLLLISKMTTKLTQK